MSVDIFNDFAVSDEPVWVPYVGDVEFLIARHDSPKYQRRASYLYSKNKRLLETKTDAADAKMREILVDTMARTVLVGWKGKVTLRGETLEYSVENATKLLNIPLFRDWVADQAQDVAAFKAVQEDETEKN